MGNKESERRSLKGNSCPECEEGKIIIDPKTREKYCGVCGVVVNEPPVDLGPEWRAYDPEQASKRVRVGLPMTYRIHDKGLGTAPPHFKRGRPRRWQINVLTSNEKTLAFALGEIDRMASAFKLPRDIREEASLLYRQAMKKGLIKGRSIEALAAAILHIVCQKHGVARSWREILEKSNAPNPKLVRKAERLLKRKLDIKILPASPVDFVPRFCSLLYLSGETRSRAITIIKRAEENELTDGRSPLGTAGAAIYIAAILEEEWRNEQDVADVAGVTVVTIRNRYREIAEGLGIDIRGDFYSSIKRDRRSRGGYFGCNY